MLFIVQMPVSDSIDGADLLFRGIKVSTTQVDCQLTQVLKFFAIIPLKKSLKRTPE